MTYSRWTNSIWYTFWSGDSCRLQFKLPTKKLKRCQQFEVNYTLSHKISYGEMVDKGINKILKDIENDYPNESYPKVTKNSLNELGGYMRIFLQDVDSHFTWINFFSLEWIYPLKYHIFVKGKFIGKKVH